jgi:Predicted transcriptional regulators
VQLWFARDGRVPIRDQLATQLLLAIASGELDVGNRLPSTRALAKRFRLNTNTVSAAYRQLETLGWVESIHGSGVYVRAKQSDPDAQTDALDRLVLPLIRAARLAGVSAEAVRDRIDYWLGTRPSRFVFVHPEPELRAIICYELRQAMAWDVEGCDTEAAALADYIGRSVFVTVPSKQTITGTLLPPATELVTLRTRRVNRVLTQYLPIPAKLLMAIVSGWPGFLQMARTVLTAVGCDPESVMFRSTHANGWDRGLRAASVVVCDAVTAKLIPDDLHKIVFPLVSDKSIALLKSFERFFSD